MIIVKIMGILSYNQKWEINKVAEIEEGEGYHLVTESYHKVALSCFIWI